MSHTTKISDDMEIQASAGLETRQLRVRDVVVIHNSDWSGSVELVWTDTKSGETCSLRIPQQPLRNLAMAVALPAVRRALDDLE